MVTWDGFSINSFPKFIKFQDCPMISPTVDLSLSKRIAFLFRLRDWENAMQSHQSPPLVTREVLALSPLDFINIQVKVSNIMKYRNINHIQS